METEVVIKMVKMYFGVNEEDCEHLRKELPKHDLSDATDHDILEIADNILYDFDRSKALASKG